MSRVVSALVVLAALGVPLPPAQAVPRTRVLTTARAYTYHPWHCSEANTTASCSSSYYCAFTVGDYVGVAYNWGGFMSLWQYDQALANGYGAGKGPGGDPLDCTAGVDCSGFVSKCWELSEHHYTGSLPDVATTIDRSEVLPGDAFDRPNGHVLLYAGALESGEPVFYEAMPPVVRYNTSGGWSTVSGMIALRSHTIEGTTAGDPEGTPSKPIVIDSFPYTDTRDTRESPSDVLDRCAADPAKNESGPEYVYKVTFTQPGTLTVGVADDAETDIDIHIYTRLNTSDCVARHNTSISMPVTCTTYYIVADTFRSSEGREFPGTYTLSVDFTSSGKGCSDSPAVSRPQGGPGSPCSGKTPYCNMTLGADACVITADGGFCSHPCGVDADCADLPDGACCRPLSSGELYCVTAASCSSEDGVAPGDAVEPGPGAPDDSQPAGGDGTGGPGMSVGEGSAGTAPLPGACGFQSAATPWVGLVLGLLVATGGLARRARRR